MWAALLLEKVTYLLREALYTVNISLWFHSRTCHAQCFKLDFRMWKIQPTPSNVTIDICFLIYQRHCILSFHHNFYLKSFLNNVGLKFIPNPIMHTGSMWFSTSNVMNQVVSRTWNGQYPFTLWKNFLQSWNGSLLIKSENVVKQGLIANEMGQSMTLIV